MHFDPSIHHRRSIRLKGYDYSREGLYFITLCTQNRVCLFGEIVESQMILNDIGQIANECWLEIPKHFPHAKLHDYVIMPNHVHGIIELEQIEGAENVLPLQKSHNEFQKMIPRSIGSIVKGYKIGVTKMIHKKMVEADNFLPLQHVWQRNYYETIIRDKTAYHNISDYIQNNPAKWNTDKLYK